MRATLLRRAAKPGHFSPLRHNANIDRYALMRDDVVETFRFTPRTTAWTVLLLGVVPVGLWWLAVDDVNKWDIRGKRRGESLYRFPLPAADGQDEAVEEE